MSQLTDPTKKLEVLLKEHEAICAQIREMVSYSDRMFGLGVTLLGAIFLFGVKENLPSITIATPFAFGMLLLFCSSIYAAILALGGYRRYLEDRICALTGDRLLTWERITPVLLHNSFSVGALSFASGSLLAASIYLSWSEATTRFTEVELRLLGAAFLVTVLLLLGSFSKLRRSHSESFRAASGAAESLPLLPFRDLFLGLPIIRKLVERASRRRGVDVAGQVTGFLGAAKTVLDLGCGTGGVSLALRARGYDVTSADVRDCSVHPEISICVVPDGKLPYSDKQFDACLLHVVLHHAHDPASLLREAARVSHRVVVGEELVASRAGKALLGLYDRMANAALSGTQNNLSDGGWRILFADAGLEVVRSTRSTVFCWIRQSIYLLEKRP